MAPLSAHHTVVKGGLKWVSELVLERSDLNCHPRDRAYHPRRLLGWCPVVGVALRVEKTLDDAFVRMDRLLEEFDMVHTATGFPMCHGIGINMTKSDPCHL